LRVSATGLPPNVDLEGLAVTFSLLGDSIRLLFAG
jgi:hypothetical protein